MHHQPPTLDAMLSSLFLLGFKGATPSDSPVYSWLSEGLSGVVLFDKINKNIVSPPQVRALTTDLYKHTASLFIAVDVEGGDDRIQRSPTESQRFGVNRLKPGYGFPHTLCAQEMGELYAQGRINEVEKNCELIASTLKTYGFNLVFAPVVDLNLNPTSPIIGRIGRSFSHDISTVIACAKIFITACQQQHIQCVLKHFPGHGSATTDSHLGITDVTESWSEKELTPYLELAELCGMVMMSHVIHHKISSNPASISTTWINKLRALGFTGAIISDDIQMAGLTQFMKSTLQTAQTDEEIFHHTVLQALQAGSDLVIVGNQLKAAPNFENCLNFLQASVRQNHLSYDKVLAKYQRITEIKRKIRLLPSSKIKKLNPAPSFHPV